MSHGDGATVMNDRSSADELESRQWAWKQSYGGLENRQQNSEPLPHTHSSKNALSVLDHNARCSRSKHSHQSKAASRKFDMSSLKLSRQFDSSDTSHVMDEGDESGGHCKVPTSKNLVSERKHRKKLNEGLYSPRALVPNISKMDNSSMVSDAVSCVQTLRNQVNRIQEDIVDLEAPKQSPAVVGSGEEDPRRNRSVAGCHKTIKQEHQIVELEVSQLEEHIYHLRIHCKKTPGILVQLTQALEALELNILNANISSVDEHILNMVVVEVKDGSVMKSEDLRNMARAIMPKFGFCFC